MNKYSHYFGKNREAVIQRDGEKCISCGMTRANHIKKFGKDITVDHIDRMGINVPFAKRNNSPDNLQTLCFKCHGAKSFNDSGARRSDHGDLSMYTNHKCRCNNCRSTYSVYMKRYKKLRKDSIKG